MRSSMLRRSGVPPRFEERELGHVGRDRHRVCGTSSGRVRQVSAVRRADVDRGGRAVDIAGPRRRDRLRVRRPNCPTRFADEVRGHDRVELADPGAPCRRGHRAPACAHSSTSRRGLAQKAAFSRTGGSRANVKGSSLGALCGRSWVRTGRRMNAIAVTTASGIQRPNDPRRRRRCSATAIIVKRPGRGRLFRERADGAPAREPVSDAASNAAKGLLRKRSQTALRQFPSTEPSTPRRRHE